MEAYTTLVNVDADTALKLATLISECIGAAGSEFFEQCQTLIAESKPSELLHKFLDETDNILNNANEKDAEGCFQALVSIMYALGSEESYISVLRTAIDKITSSASGAKTTLRLRVLVSLFNLLVSVKAKVEVLRAIFRYSLDTNQSSLVSHYHSPMVSSWFGDWSLRPEDQRELLLLVAKGLSREVGGEGACLKHYILYLSSYTAGELPASEKELAKSTLIQALGSPVSSFEDRNTLLEVIEKQPQLAKSDEGLSNLVALLRVLCSESPLEGYLAYQQKSCGDSLTSVGLSSSSVLQTSRLLTLCHLMSSSSSKADALSYTSVASALQVNVDEVELWVIDAVSSGLVEASMDEVARTITVSRCAHTSFSACKWQQVQTSLASWRASVVSVRDALDNSSSAISMN